jgi:hypothetical protein
VGIRAGLDDVEKRKFLSLPGHVAIQVALSPARIMFVGQLEGKTLLGQCRRSFDHNIKTRVGSDGVKWSEIRSSRVRQVRNKNYAGDKESA